MYTHEVLHLKLQLLTLPPSLKHHLTWDRFVNTHGGPGNNILTYLHNEHINKVTKGIIVNMGSNLKEKSLTRAARSVTCLAAMTETFDRQTGLHGFIIHDHRKMFGKLCPFSRHV